MSFFEELKELGVDVEEGLERVMGDGPLYETMLGMYIDKVNGSPIRIEDFDADNLDDLIARVHMLKGLTGNLAMKPLYDGYLQALDLLRTNCPQDAKKKYEQILPVQDAVIDCIKQHRSA